MAVRQDNQKSGSVWFAVLHGALFVSACAGMFGKRASLSGFMTRGFILYYGCMLLALGVYAVIWQQVLKHLPVTAAYTMRAVTVIWGMILGHAVFGEVISAKQITGAVIVITGCILYSLPEPGKEGHRL